jgi:hypothetical protein
MEPISSSKIIQLLSKVLANSYPSLDSIPYTVWKLIYDIYRQVILHIITTYLSNDFYTPTLLYSTRFVLPEKNKLNFSLLNSY